MLCSVLRLELKDPTGHAVRMAIDMGVNRSFIHLLRSGMGKGKSAEELEEERHLVVHSRVWFCVSPRILAMNVVPTVSTSCILLSTSQSPRIF